MAGMRSWRDTKPGEHRHTREVVTLDPEAVAVLQARVDQLEDALRTAIEALTSEMAKTLRVLHEQETETRAKTDEIEGTLRHIAATLPRAVA